jgi:pilus assembly protein CpaE
MRILIISSQLNFRQQVQAACLGVTEENVSVRTAETTGQGLELAVQFEAEIIFMDLTRNVEAGMIAIKQLANVSNRLVVVSIDKLSTEFMTRSVRAGAREVLSQPVQEEEVREIVKKAGALLNNQSTIQPARTGKAIMFFSSKGGVGKTTLATNLAVSLQNRLGGKQVALIDANTQAPNISPMLDLRPERWLRDAIAEYKRLDGELLSELMTVHPKSGLHVLAHSTDNPLGLDFSEDQLSKILLVSKGSFEWTIVDTFPLLSSLNLSMMDLCDEIFLVTEAVVPSLRSAKYNLEVLKKAGFNENKLKVIINRYSSFKGNVEPDLVQETLAWAITAVIPYDMSATVSANNGEPVVIDYPNSKISYGIQKLTDLVLGVETNMNDFEESFLQKNFRIARQFLGM